MGTGIRVALSVIVVVLPGVVLGQNTNVEAARMIRITVPGTTVPSLVDV
jgi:hypothetical protein